jgi:hypothetical protein
MVFFGIKLLSSTGYISVANIVTPAVNIIIKVTQKIIILKYLFGFLCLIINSSLLFCLSIFTLHLTSIII